jgi:hypothetical protein
MGKRSICGSEAPDDQRVRSHDRPGQQVFGRPGPDLSLANSLVRIDRDVARRQGY